MGREGLPTSNSLPLLQHLRAPTVLEWIAVPVLAMADDGSIAFVNWAFADMVGYTPEMVLTMRFEQIFAILPERESSIAMLRENAETIVELMHLDGSMVQATMSEPLVLGDGELALTTFDDMTERLWLDEL